MELVKLNLHARLMVSLKNNKRGKFDLVLKGDCDPIAFKHFIAEKGLVTEET